MRRIVVVLSLVAAGLTIAAYASGTSAAPDRCQGFRAYGSTFALNVGRGGVSCAAAGKVLKAFIRSDYQKPEPAFPLAARIKDPNPWTIDGWGCSHGSGGGACLRGGTNPGAAKKPITAVRCGAVVWGRLLVCTRDPLPS